MINVTAAGKKCGMVNWMMMDIVNIVLGIIMNKRAINDIS